VPDRTELERDQAVELVAAVGRGGQPEPSTRRDLFDGMLEARRRDVMAFIRDHQSIAAGEELDVVLAGQAL
jgi:hypothetical protein